MALAVSLIQKGVSLTRLNTLALPSLAEYLAKPKNDEETREVLAFARDKALPVTVLGRGSNIIPLPSIEGIVIIPSGEGCYWQDLDGQYHDFASHIQVSETSSLLHVDAGVEWQTLVTDIASSGFWGTENLALIPGQAGAAPVQNIGAYGVEFSDIVEEVHCIDIADGNKRVLNATECRFGYRASIFKEALKGKVVITRVVLHLSKNPCPRLSYADLATRVQDIANPLAVVEAVSSIRRSKLPDPAILPNAGSFFKNPVVSHECFEVLKERYSTLPSYETNSGIKLAAGWLIDQCGLKGSIRGHFGIHEQQALVIVHYGGGSAEELLEFSDYISSQVKAKFGVALEREPQVIGTLL